LSKFISLVSHRAGISPRSPFTNALYTRPKGLGLLAGNAMPLQLFCLFILVVLVVLGFVSSSRPSEEGGNCRREVVRGWAGRGQKGKKQTTKSKKQIEKRGEGQAEGHFYKTLSSLWSVENKIYACFIQTMQKRSVESESFLLFCSSERGSFIVFGKLGMEGHTCNPSTSEAEVRGL
jgi:hypothetical protein